VVGFTKSPFFGGLSCWAARLGRTSFHLSDELWQATAKLSSSGERLRSLPETVRLVLLLINAPVTLPLSLLFLSAGRPTARVSADRREAETPPQANGDGPTWRRRAGCNYRQA